MPAYVRYTLAEFLTADSHAVLGRLSEEYAKDSFASQYTDAIEAWKSQIKHLRTAAESFAAEQEGARDWAVLLEYPIPRRAKRIDAVILAADVVFVLEFKGGRRVVDTADRNQVEDYALDLRDFHVESRSRTIIPILVAPESTSSCDIPAIEPTDPVQRVVTLTGHAIAAHLHGLYARHHQGSAPAIDPARWDASEYRPVPTIIEAARQLYATHRVREISRTEAGAENLTRTAEEVLRIIRDAESNRAKAICFITGVPGAGKTLAGLNIVHGAELHAGKDTLGVFLSGNKPLVDVLTESLAQERSKRHGESIKIARRHVSAFVQNVHHFLREYGRPPSPRPPENVAIFDEAQRAWDLEQSARKFKRDKSEPELMLEIMDRLEWAAVVALVGTGQEINSGEAGLPEWGRALRERFPKWRVHISETLAGPGEHATSDPLFPEGCGDVVVATDADLHLAIPQRSFRAQSLASWVEDVLAGRTETARGRMATLCDYPIKLTRDLEVARRWLRESTRGTRRSGLIASSGARRLRPYGLDVTAKLDARDWFLKSARDVRSSSFLEVVATEFAVQGLELDWAGVCWDADFRRKNNAWVYKRFTGTRWTDKKNPASRRYALNKYRVLLTRAREGMVIWIPEGSHLDETRSPSFYDETAEYLCACGAESLDR